MLSRIKGPTQEFLSFVRSDRDGAAMAQGGVGSLAMKLLHAALTLAVAALLARVLGPAQFGVYAFALAVVTILAIPIQFGLPTLVVRETAAGRARSDTATVRGIWRWSLRFALVASVVVILAATIFLALSWEQLSSTSRWTFQWALALAPLLALGALHGAMLRGLDRVVLGQLLDHVLRLAILLALIVAALAWKGELSAPRAMGMHVTAAILALFAASAFLRRIQPDAHPVDRVVSGNSRRWILAILPLGFIAAAQIINTRADTLLLGIMAGPESVGLYQVAVQGAQTVVLTLAAINLVVAPRFAALYERGEIERLQRLVTLSARAVVLLTLPVVLILIFCGGYLIRWIFGIEYQPAHWPLTILAAGQLANAGFGSVAMLLNMTGHERTTARGLAIAAALNIMLNLILIPPFGIDGAAAATAFSLVAWNGMLWYSTQRLIGINTLAFGQTSCGIQRG